MDIGLDEATKQRFFAAQDKYYKKLLKTSIPNFFTLSEEKKSLYKSQFDNEFKNHIRTSMRVMDNMNNKEMDERDEEIPQIINNNDSDGDILDRTDYPVHQYHAKLFYNKDTRRYQIDLDIPQMYTKQNTHHLSCRKKSSKDVYRFSTNPNKLEKRFNKCYEGSMVQSKLDTEIKHFKTDLKNCKNSFSFDLNESIGNQYEIILISQKYLKDKFQDNEYKGRIQYFLSPYFEICDLDTNEPLLIINKQSMEDKTKLSVNMREEYTIFMKPPFTLNLAFHILCSLEWKVLDS